MFLPKLIIPQDSEWEVINKPTETSSPQVNRKDQTSSSSHSKAEPPTSLPSSPSKKEEGSSTTSDGMVFAAYKIEN